MAKKSSIVKNNKRRQLVAKHAETRSSLKRRIKISTDFDEIRELVMLLDNMAKDSSATRVRNRCAVKHCGRPRGFYRLTGMCRCCSQSNYKQSNIPGLSKASW